jgi:hypothetical protein
MCRCVFGLVSHTVSKSTTQSESLFNFTFVAFFRDVSKCLG